MDAVIRSLESLSEYVGRAVAWLTLAMVLVTVGVVVVTGQLGVIGQLTVSHSTITGNADVFGIFVEPGRGTATVKNSIIADNSFRDCEGPFTSLGHNFIYPARTEVPGS